MAIHPVFIQAGAYGIVLLMAIGIVAALLKGFFWKYVRVRLSFGRLVMIKVRSKLRDYFTVGWVEEGFLIHKNGGKEHRLSLKDKNAVYRSLAVNWIDVDEEKNSVCNVDYDPVAGFDAKKYNDLYIRALMQPEIGFGKEKIIIAMLVVIGVAVLVGVYLTYTNSEAMRLLGPQLSQQIAELANAAKGTVVGSSSNI